MKTVLYMLDWQLLNQPNVETKNRKPMRPIRLAPWELRIGSLRVYYDFEEHPEPKVVVAAVGVKERNRVRIGGRGYRPMTKIELKKASEPLSKYAQKARKDPIIVKRGKPFAAVYRSETRMKRRYLSPQTASSWRSSNARDLARKRKARFAPKNFAAGWD